VGLVSCIAGQGSLDRDGDGFATSAAGGSDCDDEDPQIHPDAIEVCGDGDDNDCNGQTDDRGEGSVQAWPDADRDEYGALTGAITVCTPPSGYVTVPGDCDDGRPDINPGRSSDVTCDGLDDDCDGELDEDGSLGTVYGDHDGDGYGRGTIEVQGCQVPEGTATRGGDCDDGRASVHPGAVEACNGRDDDCDGEIDTPVLGTGPACPAPSCRDLFDRRTDVATGPYYLGQADGPDEPVELYCVEATDGRGAWTRLNLDALQATPALAVFETDDDDGGAEARWQGEEPWLDAGHGRPGNGCDGAVRLARLDVHLPHAFQELRGSFTLRGEPTADTFAQQDDDALPAGWGELPASCRGAVRFGTQDTVIKPSGSWGVDWPGFPSSPRSFETRAIHVGSDQTLLRWEVAGGSRADDGATVVERIQIYVR